MILSTVKNIVKKSLFFALDSFLFLMRPNHMYIAAAFLFARNWHFSKKKKVLQKAVTTLRDQNTILRQQLNLPPRPEMPTKIKRNRPIYSKQTAYPNPIHSMRV
ncbi:MAG: hypothetical protein AAGI66_02670 [Cyanobacteria bacterium P01_H01_bin.74]